MKKLNKKGFTLIELLAVIVILAVVMMIAATAIGPLTTRARKSAFATEGISAIDSAKTAFQAEQLKPNSGITATKSVCFDIAWMKNKNYYTKGSGWAANNTVDESHDGYEGSVLITVDGDKYTYQVWLSNGEYSISGKSAEALNADYDTNVVAYTTGASKNCGGSGYALICSGTGNCTAKSGS